ncbi:hypothetical protein LOK49_LG05G03156 [Camellia lanceoleosa]|uniref:Uncharacterized protein n=1 Tax=Camellia lanceoleosa TaxID=1840588 RepID=A0ACC0HS37_9ERIC|nr:hypothetical protein LOK49_LG05G03156 [Camellia lanceoleosa]
MNKTFKIFVYPTPKSHPFANVLLSEPYANQSVSQQSRGSNPFVYRRSPESRGLADLGEQFHVGVAGEPWPKTASKALKGELEAIKAAIEAAKRTSHSKDEAYMRRCEALQRSLKALDATSKMWRQRAEMAESLLLKERPLGEVDEDTVYVVNGGQIDLLTDDDSQKWKLLCDGKTREIFKFSLES